MLKTRVIPCLLLKSQGLVKTVRFEKPKYVGDPINTVKIFNEKEVDEIIILDIKATVEQHGPQIDLISEIASECFLPVCYGGGIKSLENVRDILESGIEKVSISSYAVENPNFIKDVAIQYGSQSIVVCVDVKKDYLGKYEVVTHNAKKNTGLDPLNHAIKMEEMGAGELLINSVDRDGMMVGYDINLIKKISEAVRIPVVACGGAGRVEDFGVVVKEGCASAVAAGSLFVFLGKHRAVLINYPTQEELEHVFK